MEHTSVAGRRRRHKKRDTISGRDRVTSMLDQAQGALILALIVAAPWLFGCTENWSIRLMNYGCFLVGLLSAVILFLDHPPRPSADSRFERWCARAFFAVNLVLLLFCLTAWF